MSVPSLHLTANATEAASEDGVTVFTGPQSSIQADVHGELDTLVSGQTLNVALYNWKNMASSDNYFTGVSDAIERGVNVNIIVEAGQYNDQSAMRTLLQELWKLDNDHADGSPSNGEVKIRACWAGCEYDSDGTAAGFMHDKLFYVPGDWVIVSSANGGNSASRPEIAVQVENLSTRSTLNGFLQNRWNAMWWTARGNGNAGKIQDAEYAAGRVYAATSSARASEERVQASYASGAPMVDYESAFDSNTANIAVAAFDLGGRYSLSSTPGMDGGAGGGFYGWVRNLSGCQTIVGASQGVDAGQTTTNWAPHDHSDEFFTELRRTKDDYTGCDIKILASDTTDANLAARLYATASASGDEDPIGFDEQTSAGDFHAKFLAAHADWGSGVETRVWIGSANFTKDPYHRSDDLIIRIRDTSSGSWTIFDEVLDYFEELDGME